MKLITIGLIILPVMAVANARTVELTIYPAKAPRPAQKYQFLPKADGQSNADAAPLYEKALQSLPGNLQMEKIYKWLKTPPDKLPRKQVQSTLQQIEPALALLAQAAKCGQCNWPYMYDDELLENLRKHRSLLFPLALKMRFQIAQGLYDDAICTAQAGFTMANHLGKAQSLLRGMVGIGITAQICRQLEQFVQRPDSPNLYQALEDLPQPVIDLTEQVEFEESDIREKVHLLMNRLDRHVTALKCIEAIRLYTAAHNGKFPDKLSDITQVSVPDDPVTHKAVIYTRTGAKAVLEMPPVKGVTKKDTRRYEVSLKEYN